MSRRMGAAGAADLERFLNPKSIVLFGASEDETKLRGRITRLIVENGYSGALYFINPSRREVAGRRCHADFTEIGAGIDLAIIVVPAGQVLGAVEACAQAGVAHVLIMSSGFAEEGGAQAEMQARIAELAAAAGMRICGPNAEGFHNELAQLSATFSPAVEIRLEEVFTASAARIGVIAQSGGVGFALYHRGRHLGLSFSSVITTGNEVDLTAADFLAYFAGDPATSAILLFLETIRDGPGFVAALELAAWAAKPVVVVKVGRSAAGGRATVSHTGSIAGWDAAYDAMFARHGVTVAEDLGRALAIVAGFVTNPLPAGQRAAVVTVSGGAGALAADRLTAGGFVLPELGAGLQQTIRGLIPSYGATGNPIDVTGQATRTGAPLRVIELLSESDETDIVMMASTMSNRTRPPVDIAGLKQLLARRLKPVFFFTYTLPSEFGLRALAEAGMVTFTSLDDAVAAAAAMLRYRQFLADWQPAALALPAQRLGLPPGILAEYSAKALLARHGIAIPAHRLLRDPAEARSLPEHFFPAAAKIQSPDIPHKTEAGGIRLQLADGPAVAMAQAEILAAAATYNAAADIHGVLVEPMAAPGVEMIVGILRDPVFGPILTVGAGGVTAELIQDVARQQGSIDAAQAMAMLRGLRTFPVLSGYRGAAAADLAAFAALIARLSAFAAAHAEEIAEIELNPVMVHPAGQGVTMIDALIVIDPLAA
jgi:acyl-CoA synthetase (NDP forming)